MDPLFVHQAQTHGKAYLAKLHDREPKPYDSDWESEMRDQPRQSLLSWRAKLPGLGKRLGHELSPR